MKALNSILINPLNPAKKIDICVERQSGSYPIYIGESLNFPELLSSDIQPNIKSEVNSDILIITNEVLARLYLDSISESLQKTSKNKIISCVLPDGESYKSLESFSQITEVLLKENFHRNVTLIALGGGVVADLTGFVAATFMRGVSFIQIPTSLLAQVDASIGGKTGINHALGKNMIGAFHQPKAVFIDVKFLATLPQEQFIAGMAEVIKHALIADLSLVEFLLENQEKILNKDPMILIEMISRSCAIKAKIVMADEQEKNIRAVLNFGHTLGHAIEKCSNYKVLHGYAVSIGMIFALKLSCLWAGFSEKNLQKSLQLLSAFKLPERISKTLMAPTISIDELWQAMQLDKKHDGKTLRVILLKDMGEPMIYPLQEPEIRVFKELLAEILAL